MKFKECVEKIEFLEFQKSQQIPENHKNHLKYVFLLRNHLNASIETVFTAGIEASFIWNISLRSSSKVFLSLYILRCYPVALTK